MPGVTSLLGNEGGRGAEPVRLLGSYLTSPARLPRGEPAEAASQSGPRRPACPAHPLCLPHLQALPHSLPREELTPGCPRPDAFPGESWGLPGAEMGWSRGLAAGPQPHPDSGQILPWPSVIPSPTQSRCSCLVLQRFPPAPGHTASNLVLRPSLVCFLFF